MRIGIILPAGLHPSGTRDLIPAILSFVERLARAHEVTVLLLGQRRIPNRFTLAGADVIDLGAFRRYLKGIHVASSAAIATYILRRARVDVVHAFWAGHAGIAAGVAGRVLRKPVVVSVSGGEFVYHKDIGYGGQASWKAKLLAERSLELADEVTSGSNDSIARIPSTRPIRWLPLGADVARFIAPVKRTRESDAPWRLLHIGSINRVKDPHTLLDTLAIIRRHRSDFLLDWVGVDTLDGEVQHRAEMLGLGAHVRFHGFLTQAELAPLCHRADMYLHASRHESQCVAAYEAAAAGLPIVGTRVGAFADLAPRGAIAVPVGDADALSGAVLKLFLDDAHRQLIAEEAQRFSLAHDADWTAREALALYERLIRERHRLNNTLAREGAAIEASPGCG